MPRRKKPAEGLESRGQDGEEEEEEKRNPANAKKKRSFVDAFIVISDSDGEQESKEESGLQKKRTKQLDRTKFAAKRKIAQMTEEEQFALALKMSEQEARQVNCQEEEEEELLRKAIAESLSSCQPSDSSTASPHLSVEALNSQGQSQPAEREGSETLGGLAFCPDTPPSDCSSHSQSSRADGNGQMDVARSPLVVLRRLSQEIIESSLVSSIIVSPGKGQPVTRSSEKSSSPAKSDSSNMLPSTLGEDFMSLSPTFGKVASGGSWRLTPRRLFTTPSSSSEAGQEPKEQLLPCTGYSVGEAGAGSSATPLWKNRSTEQCDSPRRSGGGAGTKHSSQPGHTAKVCVSTEHAEQNKGSGSTPDLCMLTVEEKHKQEEARNTVHYYWGIPFCPKGVDPNQYTKVILCQLEVYQKSLKQAQRQLLHKKEFGNPVVPSPSLSQNELGKGEEISRENGVAGGTEDGDTEGQESENISWLHPSKRREAESPGHSMEEEKNSTSDDEPTTSYCQPSQVLPAEDVPEDGEPMQIAQSISTMTPLGSKRSPNTATENSAEEEISVCPETQPSPLEAVEEEREELCSDSRGAPMQVGGDEDAGRTVSERSAAAAARVSCPLCEHSFPAHEIEVHAMYCNGTAGPEPAQDAPVLTRRQREARNKAATGKSSPPSSDIDKCEKCYLCKSLVPLLQYQRHVDSCLQAARQAQGTRRLRRAKDTGRQERGLLRMLELSESKSEGADAGTPLTGLGDQQSSPTLSATDGELSADSPISLQHLPSHVSPAKPGISLEAMDGVVDSEARMALHAGSQTRPKGCRRRRHKF
ncbi:BRCA1-A complex subunit RAP80 isoform X1 [Pyrgilauda ruficollis]|uniref:BRCA1-A complex subunit RAP80 isoform X1 n=3 Tax=Pyrgilauda ruficollis TaxID=221976 RepID=UPI001B85D00F|nr:BRCA1-A complex subunit RAP80 isoform X1 [Pyrgilauda ruficollis]XP_041337920.1 BRCA1-A complex subunit RAP80 isoform X1 [Pyrgilauda ruficollis]XP_041337921.1 BRCA1-A complex subunit RAP80 isoform X1 [Pyrgilauda ruficollis]